MAVHVVDHPLVRHKLGILRKESTSTSEFRMLAKEIARLLMYEATKQFKTEKRTIKGWAGPVEVESISGKMVTIDLLKKRGCKCILSLNLVCAPEGIKRVEEAHPDVDIYTAAVDSHLDEHGYIIPGLGDAGDRIFGTR